MQRLSSLGELRTGFQLRGAAKHKEGAPNTVIQLGDARDDGIDISRLVRMDLERARERDFVTSRDILLRSRGASYRAVLTPDCPPGTVAAAPLYILRPDRSIVLPEYLAWFINRPATQATLTAQARGTYIPSVSIQAFGDLEILIPPLEEQRKIAETDALLKEEKALTLRLLEQKEQYVQALLEQSLTQPER